MAAPLLPYYEAVADRLVPFLRGRKIAVEQRFAGAQAPVFRRHEGRGAARTWIRIRDAQEVVRWARQYAVAFHAHLRPDGPGCWFLLDIDARGLDLEMARIAAVNALQVCEEQGLRALVKFSGSDGFHLMWEMPRLAGLGPRSVWDLERAVVVAVARQVERRLEQDPRAAPVRVAVGPDRPLIATGSQDAANRRALLFDEHILKPNVNARVPFSIHAGTGLVAVPLDRAGLERFDLAMASPEIVAVTRQQVEMPRNELAAVKAALAQWDIGND